MQLFRKIPLTSRPTFGYHISAACLYGIQLGIVAMASVYARKSLHASKVEIALIIAAPSAGMLWSLYWGHLASYRRKMQLFLWPALIGRGILFLVALASNSVWFTVVILTAYSIDMLTVPVQAGIIKANYPDECRGMIVGRISGMLYLVSCISAFLAGKFMDRYIEWAHCLYFLAAAAGVASALTFSRIKVRREKWIENHTPERFSPGKTLGVLFSNPKFGIFQLFFSISALMTHMSRPVIILFLTDVIRVDYTQAATVIEVVPRIFMVLTFMLAGAYIDRWNPMLVRAVFVLIGCASPLIIYLSHSIGPVYLAMVLWGIAIGGGGIVWAIGSLYFAPERLVPAYQGVHTTLTGVRGLLGPLMGVWLYNIMGLKVLLFASVVHVFCGVALLVVGLKEQNRESEAASGL